ncbi:MAG: hypothetical protein E7380_02270 [Clostridiales bacterium]|nr:hypothetical protein [Clostridiales bacterium]
MNLHFLIIGISMLVISVLNILFSTATWYYVVIAVVWCTALQFALDGFLAIAINKMPDKWFGAENRFYHVTKRERALYKKLKVRLWKDKLWELGGLGGFSKKELKQPNNPEYIEKFIIECNKGVLVHRISYFIGFLAALTLRQPYCYTIAIPVAAVNLLVNALSTIVLRYNSPALIALYKRLQRRERKNQAST